MSCSQFTAVDVLFTMPDLTLNAVGANGAGPRKLHEGTAEMEHRVLKVVDDPHNSFTEMHVTLLAAGFVIGPSGQSVRAICEKSGAHIQSSTRSGVHGPHRRFAILGNDKCRTNAQHIIESAINLYQQLFRGLGPYQVR